MCFGKYRQVIDAGRLIVNREYVMTLIAEPSGRSWAGTFINEKLHRSTKAKIERYKSGVAHRFRGEEKAGTYIIRSKAGIFAQYLLSSGTLTEEVEDEVHRKARTFDHWLSSHYRRI